MTTDVYGWAKVFTLACGGSMAVLVGASLAVLPLPATVLLLSMGVLLTVLLAPWPLLLCSFLVVLGFIVGPLQYLGGFSKAFWLPYLMGVLMAVRVLSDSLFGRQAPPAADQTLDKGLSIDPHRGQANSWEHLGMRAALSFAGVFAMTLVLSSLVNRVGVLQAVVAGKEYLFLWSLPAAFALGLLKTPHLRLLWPSLAAWLTVQALVVLWQRFIVAPRRGGDAPWDAVVGLFAGKANGAGGSGTMAMVSLWAAAGVVMAWRAGVLRWPWALMAGLSVTLACALAEVKVAVVLLPLLGLMVWIAPSPAETKAAPNRQGRSWVWQRLVALGSVLGISILLFWSHQQQFTATGSLASKSPARYLETTLERNLDDRTWADEHGQLTRLGALQYWWTRQSASDIPGWLIGHGVGAVRRSALAPSPLLQGLRFEPGRSTAVILLWETGVLGLASWLFASLSFLVLSVRLLRSETAALEAVFLRAAAAAIVVTMLSLPYGADWFEAPHLAVMHLLGVAWVCSAYRRTQRLHEQPPGYFHGVRVQA
ncbi:MAG: hypothetical protein EBS47_07020 [Betaproteobacteria bacterium]|nr:hypothetical protein [Betaproteobacteria bacterium]NBU49845.1 hypothetical protein [Betaproteobacteria bacterium]